MSLGLALIVVGVVVALLVSHTIGVLLVVVGLILLLMPALDRRV